MCVDVMGRPGGISTADTVHWFQSNNYETCCEREFRSIYEMCSATEHKVYREERKKIKKGKKVCREGKKICKSVNKVRKKKKDLKNSYSAKEINRQ